MTSLYRVRAIWTGFQGAPGVSTFYGLVDGGLAAAVHTFFNDIKSNLPSDVHIQVQGDGDVLEDTTGELTGTFSDTTPAVVDGADGSTYAAPAGLCINWLTDSVIDGHRTRGRTFLVPWASDAFQNDGTIGGTSLAMVQAAGVAMVGTAVGNLVVWHRPRAARAADGSRPAVTARAGSHALVTACSAPDKAVVLRSRRD